MSDITLDIDKDVIFIDLSYYIFYRYYATYNWLRKQNDSEDVTADEILNNTLFCEKFPAMFERNICEIVRIHKVKWNNVFLVKDCLREHIWRNKLFTEYKSCRDDRLATFNRDIFRYTYNKLLPVLQEKYGFQIIGHDCLEADDVIAIMKSEIRTMNNHTKIIIITNDNDYIQLIDDNTLVKNLQGREIKTRVEMSPDQYLKCKLILGDKSDNIPCIMKNVGPKRAEKMVNDKHCFDMFCEKYPSALSQYELNKQLIDFACIPKDIKDAFTSRLMIKTT